ncbi:hypothetical protein BG011_001660, partial [Mortierella polycephala]
MAHLTPPRLHLDSSVVVTEVPRWRHTLPQFFQDNAPSRWLLEQFADAVGGDDSDEFFDGIAVAMRRKWALSAHFARLYRYYTEEEAGNVQINLIRQRALTNKKRSNAQEKTLGDLYDNIASSPAQEKTLGDLYDNIASSSTQPQDPASTSSGDPSGLSQSNFEAAQARQPEQQTALSLLARVHDFFLQSPASAWLDHRAFSRYVLSHDSIATPNSSYRTYRRSLRHIAHADGQAQWQRIARQAEKIRESAFKAGFLSMQGELMRKRKRDEDSRNERRPHDALWGEDLLSSDTSDGEFVPKTLELQSDTDSMSNEEDLTGEIPCPNGIDQFTGPGTFSSNLFCDLSSHTQIADQDINILIMAYRRTHVIETQAAIEDEHLLINFVVTKAMLVTVLPDDITRDNINNVFPDAKPACVSLSEHTLVAQLCAHSAACGFATIQEWFEGEQKIGDSIVYRAVSNFFIETSLWVHINWNKLGGGSNEDTFIHALLKPILVAAFGLFAGSMFRWSRDPLHTGKVKVLDSVLEFPDYQVSFGEHAYILGEFKPAIASSEDMRKDYMKLVIMGKKAVDGLFRDGYPTPVILIHGQGMDVDVYSISLRSEAFYSLVNLGKFRLVSNPYEFGQLLSLGPLITAQITAASSFELLKSGKRVETDRAWMRGTFD